MSGRGRRSDGDPGAAQLDAAAEIVRGTVAAARRRLRLRGAARWGAGGAHVGAWGAVVLAGILAPSSPLGALAAAVALVAAVVVASALVGAARTPLDPRAAALVLDRVSGSQELLLNALHAVTTEAGPNRAATLAAALHGLPEARALPVQLPRHARFALAPLALVVLLVLLGPRLPGLPWPGGDAPAAPEDDAVAAALESIARASGDAPVLPPELRRELASLSETLASAPLDPEEARAELERMQQRLEAFREGAADRRSLLEELEAAAEAAAAAAPEVAEALREGDLAAAESAARQLAESGSDAQREAAGDALDRAGEALSRAGDPTSRAAGEALRDAARDLRGGASPEQLAQDLARARDAGAQLAKDREALEQAQELGARFEEARQRLGGEPGVDPGQGEPGEGAAGESGKAGEAGEGAPGEGQGEGAGAPAAGGNSPAEGAGAGHTWEDQGEFRSSVGGPSADGGSEGAHQQIDDFQRYYDELRLAGAKTLLAGEAGELHEAGRVDTFESRLTTAEEVAKAGTVDLPATYRAAADEAITQEGVPAAYREVVKQYFEQAR